LSLTPREEHKLRVFENRILREGMEGGWRRLHNEELHNLYASSSSFLGSTAQLRPWPPPKNPSEFLGGFSTIFFFTG
jgi:hypothetical protein